MAQAEENAIEIDGEDLTPGIIAVVHQFVTAAGHTGIVDQDIKPAEIMNGMLNSGGPIGMAGHVVQAECGLTASGRDAGSNILAGQITIGQQYRRAILGQPPRGCRAQTRSRTCNQSHLA